MKQESSTYSKQTGMVWDIPLRIVHWGLVLSVILAYATYYVGGEFFSYHIIIGYVVIVLVSFRLVWGIFGTHHSKFVNFNCQPKKVFLYVKKIFNKEEELYLGHNPLASIMALLLLASMLVQGISGLFVSDDVEYFGPMYFWVEEETSGLMRNVHRLMFHVLMAFVVIHVLAAVAHFFFGEKTITFSIVNGQKVIANKDSNSDFVTSSKLFTALCLFCLVTGGLAVLWFYVQSASI
ncbi:cytochrome b/b6 domain-containing protein [Catenovulum sediminis]|uniref:Cytochrome b/b6 domain-containing protein n=1 Tax=Catenovulum sediminis TaxID=1740262 RepID=A0ABV1RNQ1_9ALTE